MKPLLTTAQLFTIQSAANPDRTIAYYQQMFAAKPITRTTGDQIYQEAISIWRHMASLGETMPHGHNLQCLLYLNRLARHMVEYGIVVPDFLYLSVSEFEEGTGSL